MRSFYHCTFELQKSSLILSKKSNEKEWKRKSNHAVAKKLKKLLLDIVCKICMRPWAHTRELNQILKIADLRNDLTADHIMHQNVSNMISQIARRLIQLQFASRPPVIAWKVALSLSKGSCIQYHGRSSWTPCRHQLKRNCVDEMLWHEYGPFDSSHASA